MPIFFSSLSNSSLSGFHFLAPTSVGTIPGKTIHSPRKVVLSLTQVVNCVPQSKLLEVELWGSVTTGREVAVPMLGDLDINFVLVEHPETEHHKMKIK